MRQCVGVRCQCVNAQGGGQCVSASVRICNALHCLPPPQVTTKKKGQAVRQCIGVDMVTITPAVWLMSRIHLRGYRNGRTAAPLVAANRRNVLVRQKPRADDGRPQHLPPRRPSVVRRSEPGMPTGDPHNQPQGER